MAQTAITLERLEAELQNVIAAAGQRSILIGALFQVMYDTGLRACEVLEPERWRDADSEYYEVQLSKGEGTRLIPITAIPEVLYQYYSTGSPFFMETYSAVNNCYKCNAPVFHFNGNRKRTTMHAFRYRYMKRQAAEGKTLIEIAAEMGHINLSNTARYVNDQIRMYEV